MKKIGILTFHNSNNYGAILQCYALQEVLAKLNFDVEIIDYISKKKIGWYKPVDFNLRKGVRHNIKQVFKLANYKIIFDKNVSLNNFKDEYYNLSDKQFIGKSEQLSDYLKKYDIISVGSDQVWNIENTGKDSVYFLNFESQNCYKKVTYAASFGSSILNENLDFYLENISRFDSISVREESGKLMLKDIEIESTKVLDPTLLLSKKDWEEKLELDSINISDTIFVYTINKDKNVYNFANSLASIYSLAVVNVLKDFRDYFTKGKMINPGIREFLSNIQNSKVVVTNSFHGVAFSIIFNKNFFVVLDSNNKANTRIYNLLSLTGLEDRVVANVEDIVNLKEINYEAVNKIIDKYKNNSINFIEKNFN